VPVPVTLLLLPKHLPVGLAIGKKAIMFTPLPSGFQLGGGDVPIRATFLQHCTQVLPKLFDGWPAKKTRRPQSCWPRLPSSLEKQQSITLVNQSFDERKIVVLRSDASDKTAKQKESDDHFRLADHS
jgi:hypothetical protein